MLAFLHRWLAFKTREVRLTTLRSYTQTLCPIAPQIGHRPLAELTVLQ
ncbi:hypothetical protein [Deinococcus metallilatus]|uniref:Integrase SAM-like N-terminal domain-containing protein n=1 Tax=Deinococcus metallilatus TaxID=1211322 RepID=A0ABR6MTT9_9DEIO|nr:hypothetical protein [Deinococcus metallilatus]MBB5295364.1 hypothetical protein [Deinococcus metallilatus]